MTYRTADQLRLAHVFTYLYLLPSDPSHQVSMQDAMVSNFVVGGLSLVIDQLLLQNHLVSYILENDRGMDAAIFNKQLIGFETSTNDPCQVNTR